MTTTTTTTMTTKAALWLLILLCSTKVSGYCQHHPLALSRRTTRRAPLVVVHASSSAKSTVVVGTVDDDWNECYQHYLNYTHTTGQYNVPLNHTLLGRWVRTQRRQYKQWQSGSGVLNPNQIALLEQAGFVFDVKEHEWLLKYEELQEFYNQHGHCRVSSNNHGSLGRWVQTQRRNQKANVLSPDRIERLDSIDFCWNPNEWSFRDKVQQVLQEKKTSVWDWKVTDGPLGLWMCQQRTKYRKFCQHQQQLPDYQVRLLEDTLGFHRSMFRTLLDVNKVPRPPVDVSWSERMEQLEAFKAEHGHVNVPRTAEQSLGTWVAKIRERYRFIGPDSSEMMQQRLDDLIEIDFIWDVCEYKWQSKFQQLIVFFEQHGHANVPDSYKSLGPWVREQRREYQRIHKGEPSRLTPQHALALNRIGLDWNRQTSVQREQDKTFLKRIHEYADYIQSSSDDEPSVASMPTALRNWVERQRKLYRGWLQGRQELAEDRRQLLEQAGVVRGIIQVEVVNAKLP